MTKVFVVEDMESIRKLIVYALKSSGYEAEGFEDNDEFSKAIEKELPDLVILDIMLPEVSGIEILTGLKNNFNSKDIPVIMLTAKSSEIDKVSALDLGADDYITKPFGVMELIARVRAVLRRAKKESNTSEISYEGIVLNDDLRKVFVDGEETVLTYKEYELLKYMLQNKKIVLSREKIMQNVWGFDFEGESRTVDMHIKTLRDKLGAKDYLIKTVRGVGYKIDSGE